MTERTADVASSEAPTRRYVIESGKYHAGGKVFRVGDAVDLNAHQARAMRYMVHRIRSEEIEADDTAENEAEEELEPGSEDYAAAIDYSFIADLSESDAITAVNGLATIGEVEAAVEAERGGKNRKAVIAAGEARIPTE